MNFENFISNKKILFISPHPDDELISSFYLLKNYKNLNIKLKIIYVSSGEKNLICNFKVYKLPKFLKNYKKIRQKEAERLLKNFDIKNYEFWNYKDLYLTQNKESLLKKLINTIYFYNPEIIISPSYLDTHKDHNILGILVLKALEKLNKKIELLFYINHFSDLYLYQNSDIFKYEVNLTSDLTLEKKNNFNIYYSQFQCHKEYFYKFLQKEKYHTFIPFNHLIDFIGNEYLWINLQPLSKIRRKSIILMSNLKSEKIKINSEYLKIHKSKLNRKYFFIKFSSINPVFDKTGFIPFKIEENKIMKDPKTCVIIPCYNIGELCIQSAKNALSFTDYIVIINDGSTDDTGLLLEKFVKMDRKINIINFEKNLGKGKAIIEGINFALKNLDFDLLITIDGDLQHRAMDIPKFKEAWKNGAEVILGNRVRNKNIPLRSIIGNFFINLICSMILKRKIKDSQCGFRGYDKKFLEKMINSNLISEGRYETEIDMFLFAHLSNARILEVDIPGIYFNKNKTSHFHPLIDSLRVLKEFIIFYKKIKKEPLITRDSISI